MTNPSPSSTPYRLMVVDDSLIIRNIITRTLEKDASFCVVASATNGEQAIECLEQAKKKDLSIDVVILDIQMPKIDGLTALPKLLAIDPTVKIIMSSTLTLRNAAISLKALELGASDYIPKPTAYDIMASTNFSDELLRKVKALADTRRKALISTPKNATSPSFLNVRPLPSRKPSALAIGASTGGPQALINILSQLKNNLNVPIFITQHMPPLFTSIFATHLQQASGLISQEAQDGVMVQPNHIYIAPGDYHMMVESKGLQAVLRLHQTPHENFCRPSVDPMFKSLAQYYRSNLLALILTGMGQDGLEGSKTVVERGGTLLAQDQETSVIWGMAGTVATAGLCTEILPLDHIATHIKKIFHCPDVPLKQEALL